MREKELNNVCTCTSTIIRSQSHCFITPVLCWLALHHMTGDPCVSSCKWLYTSIHVTLVMLECRISSSSSISLCYTWKVYVTVSISFIWTIHNIIHTMKKLNCSLPKIFIVILSIELIHMSALPRMRKMLVRRKIPVGKLRNDNNSSVEERQIIKPIKIVKRKLITSSPPVLSSPLLSESPTTTSPLLPQHKPFTVNETVAAKPDAVKRCKDRKIVSSWQ